MRFSRFAVVVAGCLLAAPAAASAGQVVFHQESPGGSDGFGVMNEDGSGQRTWLRVFEDVPPSGGQRFVTAYEPKISTDGRRVVFTTYTTANKEPGCLGLGANAQGVNLWEAGAVRRLSPPPAPAQGVSTFESDGVPAADGRIYYSRTGGTYSCATFQSAFGTLQVFTPAGADGGAFDAACTGIGLGTGGIAPDPADPSVLAYGGCDESGREAIHVGASGGAPDVVARLAPETTDGYSSRVEDPAWRPDGGRIVSVEAAGQGPDQLVGYAPDGSGAVRMTTAPAGTQLSSPVFVGSGTVAFTVSTGSGEAAMSDIYTLPATCADCALTSATRLTSGGRSSSPSWSPAALYTPPAAPAPAPSPVPAPSTPAPGTPSAPSALRTARPVKAKRGLAVEITLRRTATVTFSVTGVSPRRTAQKTTRKLKAGTTTIRLTSVAGRRLGRGTYRITVGLKGSKRAVRLSGRVRR